MIEPAQRQTIRHVPALDGVRAVAVIAIMLFHGGLSWIPGGYFAIDLFFVVSGFLITSLLLSERATTGRIDFKQFWMRRVRRLLPALLVMLSVCCLAAAFWLPDGRASSFRVDAISALLYVSNWRFIFEGSSYFASDHSPLGHLWSLSVEEQWYLIFPPIAGAVLVRSQNISRLINGMVVAAFGSALAMGLLYSPSGDGSRAYFGTDTRIQALLVGAILAAVAAERPLHLARSAISAWAGLGGLFLVFAFLRLGESDTWMYYGGYSLLAVGCAGVVAGVAVLGEPVGFLKFLASKPLVQVGKISYGLYLWHWPVNVFLTPTRLGFTERGIVDTVAVFGIRTAVACAFATASYLFIEHPIRAGGFSSLRLRFPLLNNTWTAVGCVGLVMWLLFASTWGRSPSATEQLLANSKAGVPSDFKPISGSTAPELTGGLPALGGNEPVVTMLTGDSAAFTLGYGLSLAPPSVKVVPRAIIGCGLVDGNPVMGGRVVNPVNTCDRWPQYWQSSAAESQPHVVAMMFGPWEVFDHEVNGQRLMVGTPELADVIKAGFLKGVRSVLSVDPTARFLVLGAPCMSPVDSDLGLADDIAERGNLQRISWVNAQFKALADSLGGRAAYADLGSILCPGGSFESLPDARKIRPDGIHFDQNRTGFVWKWISERSVELARPAVLAADLPKIPR